jgi:[FeFe] hydrogenase H-cluster maturation GTPase HydF
MGFTNTTSDERIHVGIFGRRNAGKSSLINSITNQNLAIVSEVKGTTTDPVHKAMELFPVGPVVMIDTPGIDDSGELGGQRVAKSYRVLDKADVAVLVVDGNVMEEEDRRLVERFEARRIPYVVAYNKCDGFDVGSMRLQENEIAVSAQDGTNIDGLRSLIAKACRIGEDGKMIVADLIDPSDFIVLVVPIDQAAPKSRLILPQQKVIRDILDVNAVAIVVQEDELRDTLAVLGKKPSIVITDSQVFDRVSADTPPDIRLTSFSILMARYKGILRQAVKGVASLENLDDGDGVLISEGCTHRRQCGDIGTVKLPRWIAARTGKNLDFRFTSGTEFPDDLSGYRLVVHCGGCMLNGREMEHRLRCAEEQGVPMTNYGILIAYMCGILKRSIEPFPDVAALLQ